MAENAKIPEARLKRAPTLYLIIAFKILKGAVAMLLALKIHKLREEDLPEQFQKLLLFLHLDPEKKFFADLADRVAEITSTNLQWVVIFSVLYGLFMLLQAGGLILRVTWVVWLVIGESAFFVPIELFEEVSKPSWIKFCLFAVNVLIVLYLYANRARLTRHHHH